MSALRFAVPAAVVAAAVAVFGAASFAERMSDNSGLPAGSFVWQPMVASEGPISIIAALNERVLHVYRGSTLIGIAPLEPQSAVPRGVYRLTPAARGSAEIVARPVFSPANRPAATSQLVLPKDFLAMLANVVVAGSVLVVAEERSIAYAIGDGGPLLNALEPQRPGGPRVAGWTTAGASDDASVPASLVVSAKAGLAKRLDDGAARTPTPIGATKAEAASIGTHVFIRTGAGDPQGARWLAMGIGAQPTLPEVANWQGDMALDLLPSPDARVISSLGQDLGPGAVVVLSDDIDSFDPAAARTLLLTSIGLPAAKAPDPVRAAKKASVSGAAKSGKPQVKAKPAAARLAPESIFSDVNRIGG